MQDMIETIRKAIRKTKREDKRTLYRLARDAGLPYATVHRFAGGERTEINLVTAARLCQALRLELRPIRKGR